MARNKYDLNVHRHRFDTFASKKALQIIVGHMDDHDARFHLATHFVEFLDSIVDFTGQEKRTYDVRREQSDAFHALATAASIAPADATDLQDGIARRMESVLFVNLEPQELASNANGFFEKHFMKATDIDHHQQDWNKRIDEFRVHQQKEARSQNRTYIQDDAFIRTSDEMALILDETLGGSKTAAVVRAYQEFGLPHADRHKKAQAVLAAV